jgi:DNA-directed RNA polymerase specialized sigma24 family protein
VSRTARHLEKGGNQTSSLSLKGKLAAEGLDQGIGEGEPDLEEFAMREDLRTLIEAAKLSDQQRRILELALDNQPDCAIAERPGLTVDAVKSSKKLARENMRRAAGQ